MVVCCSEDVFSGVISTAWLTIVLSLKFGGGGLWCGVAFWDFGLAPQFQPKGDLMLHYTEASSNSRQFKDGSSLFQHDCALVLRAGSIKTWMREFGMEEPDWGAQSPDFKPIEHLWDELRVRPWAKIMFSSLRIEKMVPVKFVHRHLSFFILFWHCGVFLQQVYADI